MFLIHPTEMPSHASMRAEQLNSSLLAALADDKRTEDILRQRASIPEDVLSTRRYNEVHITPEQALRSGPRNLDSGLSEISIVFQAAVPKPVVPKYTASGVRRPSEL